MNRSINFTIVPEEPADPASAHREYANFCAVAHTPFDLTLTFCDVRPLSERDIQAAESSRVVHAPVVSRVVLPFGVVPGLIAALQEQMRAIQEAAGAPEPPPGPGGGPLH